MKQFDARLRLARSRPFMLKKSSLVALLGLALFTLLWGACASSRMTTQGNQALSQEQIQNSAEVEAARAKADAAPTDLEARRALTRALLKAGEFLDAYAQAQAVREAAPESPDSFTLLGQACLGLGLFDEAAACHLEALKRDPNREGDEAALALLLQARGNGHLILSQLSERPDIDINLLSRLEARLDELEAPPEGKGVEVAVNGPVFVTPLTDTYKVSVILNGRPARLQLDMSSSVIMVGDRFAMAAGLPFKPTSTVQGIADSGVNAMGWLVLDQVGLGNAILKSVPVAVVNDLDRSTSSQGYEGFFGVGLLRGYSYRMDRKGEELTFYPPGTPLPPRSSNALVAPYYGISGQVVTAVKVQHLDTKMGFTTQMVVNPAFAQTLLNLDYAIALGYGIVNTTRRTTLFSGTNYFKAVEVSRTALSFGGLTFAYPTFLAAPIESYDRFKPHGTLGRNVLGEFIITVDAGRHELILEPYPQ